MNWKMGRMVGGLVLVALNLVSCFKKELPITDLPPKTGSTILQVQMGAEYDTTSYINLELGKVVGKSLHYNWDIKLEAGAEGKHILLNSGKSVRMCRTQVKDLTACSELPANPIWEFDARTICPDSSCIADWYDANGNSKNEVYIIRIPNKAGTQFQYKKIQIVDATNTAYTLRYAPLDSASFNTLIIPKDSDFNYVYADLSKGNIVDVEPPKTTWDFEISRFSHVYYELTPVVNYQVNGALHNPYQTISASDTLNEQDFMSFTKDNAMAMQWSPFVNSLGFTWKNFNFTLGDYEVYDKYMYAIRTQKNQLYKLHFIGYKTATGEQYAPKMEWERLD